MNKLSEFLFSWDFLQNASWISLAAFYVWAFIIILFFRYKKKRLITPSNLFFTGTFISGALYFFPLYHEQLTFWESVFSSIQHAFRLFALDGDYIGFVAAFADYPSESAKKLHLFVGSILYFLAPLLSFSFILSFFKNLFSRFRYFIFFPLHAHVFSELNQKSLALARDIVRNDEKLFGFIPTELIVFTDHIAKNEEASLDITEDAKELGAIIFSKDLEGIRYRSSFSPRKVNFYLISEDEPEKIRHANYIMQHYDHKNVTLKVFSNDIRTKLLLATKNVSNMEVARINDIRSLIYHTLDVDGIKLFERARDTADDKNVISVVLVGLGRYGCEMLKALTWYCQIPGYRLKINAFDTDPKALEKFTAMCPELMSISLNHQQVDGEAGYDITIHPDVDVTVPDFEEKLSKITDATYIFVCLGNDELNISVATKIRSLCERTNYPDDRKPDIETVVYNSDLARHMRTEWSALCQGQTKGLKNHRGQPYNILMIGDLDNFYSTETVINSKLVDAGWQSHLSYCISTAKLRFTENHMQEEWADFLTKTLLTAEWSDYIKSYLAKKGKAPDDSYKLSDAKADFPFIRKDEEASAEAQATIDKVKARKDSWHSLAEAKIKKWPFDSKELRKEWEACLEETTIKARNEFWLCEYNYNSSIAKALYERLKEKFETSPVRFKPSALSEQESRSMEHIRWNAYMRTEGFRYNATRNDLALQHHDLVPCPVLLRAETVKDS